MLTGKQKRYLRSQAHHLPAFFQIGKEGVQQPQIESMKNALHVHELLKVKILRSCPLSKDEVATMLQLGTGGQIVQTMGHTIVLFAPSKKRIYQLP